MCAIVKFSTVDATESSGRTSRHKRFRLGETILFVAHAGERGRSVDPGGIAPAAAHGREHPLATFRGRFHVALCALRERGDHVRVAEAIDADVLQRVARPHRQAPGEIELVPPQQRISLQRQHGRAQEAVGTFQAR